MRCGLAAEDELPEREEQKSGERHGGRQRQNPCQEQVAHRAPLQTSVIGRHCARNTG